MVKVIIYIRERVELFFNKLITKEQERTQNGLWNW